MKKRLSREKTN